MADTQTKTGSQLAQDMLAQQQGLGTAPQARVTSTDDEVEQSNQIAETLTHLQNVIQRNADQLKALSEELKVRRDSLRSIFENDAELAQAEEEVKQQTDTLKQRKAKVASSAETIAIKTEIDELRAQMTEIEEALNSHLLNYYALTNSTSIDTPDGDQREFTIKAKLKLRW